MADAYRVERVAVRPEPLVSQRYDYADAFELRLGNPDPHTAEQWLRTGLEGSGALVRGLIRFVHGRVARFALSREPGNVLGWHMISSAEDVVHLRTEGPLLRAEIVARRLAPSAVGFTTFLFYKHRATPFLWAVIGPLHRRIAPYLLARAASILTGEAVLS